MKYINSYAWIRALLTLCVSKFWRLLGQSPVSVFIMRSACVQTSGPILCDPIGSSPSGTTQLLLFVIRLCAFVCQCARLIDWFTHIVKIFKLFQMSRHILLNQTFGVCDWWQRYRLERPVPSNWSFSNCRSHFPRFNFLKPGFISIYEQDIIRFSGTR